MKGFALSFLLIPLEKNLPETTQKFRNDKGKETQDHPRFHRLDIDWKTKALNTPKQGGGKRNKVFIVMIVYMETTPLRVRFAGGPSQAWQQTWLGLGRPYQHYSSQAWQKNDLWWPRPHQQHSCLPSNQCHRERCNECCKEHGSGYCL